MSTSTLPEPSAETLQCLSPDLILVEAKRLGFLETGDVEDWLKLHPQFRDANVAEKFYQGVLKFQGEALRQARIADEAMDALKETFASTH